ncbi:site-specific DNA-methyltransferase [Cupriavidus sp. D384]|uniref:site-specific DNA-methyltransferase n=1 Tax=Cupriavidus sp. D384 TaxID=1538095 RepID=UPI000830D983|nr:DNA methyltransferase [Cupriavidus sp. D384]
MTQLAATFRLVHALVPYERNARRHTADQIAEIAESLRQFGWTLPVLADARGIVAGHARVEAAKRIYEGGESIRLPDGEIIPPGTVPVLDCTGWTVAQRRAYIIADNRLAESANWDEDLLSQEIDALADLGFDINLLGFDADELAGLRPGRLDAGLTDPDAVPEPPAEPTCKPGDIWQLGEHRLLCGDSTDPSAFSRLLAGAHADLVITDPPYNVAYEGRTAKRLRIANDALASGEFAGFLGAAFRNIAAACRPGAGVYVFHADTEGVAFRQAFEAAGLKLAQCCVWVKQSFVLGRQDYHWQHEPVLYGWKPGAAHVWHGDRSQSTVWNFDRPTKNDDHPTMKPVEMLEYLLTNSSKAGDLVLDPFAGSGSTLIACEQRGRRCVAVELDPRYCDVVIRRWEEFAGDSARIVTTLPAAGVPRVTDEIANGVLARSLAAVKAWLRQGTA